MKIVFYDIKEPEYIYFNENLGSNIEAHFESEHLNSSTQIKNSYKDIDALSVFVSSNLDSAVLKRFPKLKYIYLRSMGYSNIDLEYCKDRNIYVFNCPDYGIDTVAEFNF